MRTSPEERLKRRECNASRLGRGTATDSNSAAVFSQSPDLSSAD